MRRGLGVNPGNDSDRTGAIVRCNMLLCCKWCIPIFGMIVGWDEAEKAHGGQPPSESGSGRCFQPLRKVRLHRLHRGLGITRHHGGQDGAVFVQ